MMRVVCEVSLLLILEFLLKLLLLLYRLLLFLSVAILEKQKMKHVSA